MENNFVIKVIPLSVVQEKHGPVWEARDREDARRRQNALDFFSKKYITYLEKFGYNTEDADSWESYPDFDCWDAAWALRQLGKAYQEQGYKVTLRDNFSKGYHVKVRMTVSARV